MPSGRVQVRVRGIDPDGRRFELCKTCDPAMVPEVRARLRVEANEIKDGLRRKKPRLTLAEYQARFRKSAPWNHERESTWRMLRPLWPLPLAQLTNAEVTKWAHAATWTGPGRPPRGKGQGSRSYVLHCWELLRRLLRAAKAEGYIDYLPCDTRPVGVPSARASRKQRRPFTPEERRAALQAARSHPDPSVYPRLALMAGTGLRPEELRAAKLENLWPAEHVCKDAPPGSLVLNCPDPIKHGVIHVTPIPPAVSEALRAYLETLPPEAKAVGAIFPRFHKGQWKVRKEYIRRKTWREVFALAEIPHELVLYQLRHTRLSEWSNDTEVGARRAADLVGHADMRTTETYAARARGLVPAAFSWDDDDPEKPSPNKPTRKKKRTAHNRETNPQPITRRNHAPVRPPTDPKLRELAELVQLQGADHVAWALFDRLSDIEAAGFARDLAEVADNHPLLVALAGRVRTIVGRRLQSVPPGESPGLYCSTRNGG